MNDLSKFKAIASDENNAFKIDDYKGLTGILEKFQTRIFKIEGDVYYSFCLFVSLYNVSVTTTPQLLLLFFLKKCFCI